MIIYDDIERQLLSVSLAIIKYIFIFIDRLRKTRFVYESDGFYTGFNSVKIMWDLIQSFQ